MGQPLFILSTLGLYLLGLLALQATANRPGSIALEQLSSGSLKVVHEHADHNESTSALQLEDEEDLEAEELVEDASKTMPFGRPKKRLQQTTPPEEPEAQAGGGGEGGQTQPGCGNPKNKRICCCKKGACRGDRDEHIRTPAFPRGCYEQVYHGAVMYCCHAINYVASRSCNWKTSSAVGLTAGFKTSMEKLNTWPMLYDLDSCAELPLHSTARQTRAGQWKEEQKRLLRMWNEGNEWRSDMVDALINKKTREKIHSSFMPPGVANGAVDLKSEEDRRLFMTMNRFTNSGWDSACCCRPPTPEESESGTCEGAATFIKPVNFEQSDSATATGHCCTKKTVTVSHCDKHCTTTKARDCYRTPLYLLEQFASDPDKYTYQTCERVSTYYAEKDVNDLDDDDFKRQVENANKLRGEQFKCFAEGSKLYNSDECPKPDEGPQEYIQAAPGEATCPPGHPYVKVLDQPHCQAAGDFLNIRPCEGGDTNNNTAPHGCYVEGAEEARCWRFRKHPSPPKSCSDKGYYKPGAKPAPSIPIRRDGDQAYVCKSDWKDKPKICKKVRKVLASVKQALPYFFDTVQGGGVAKASMGVVKQTAGLSAEVGDIAKSVGPFIGPIAVAGALTGALVNMAKLVDGVCKTGWGALSTCAGGVSMIAIPVALAGAALGLMGIITGAGIPIASLVLGITSISLRRMNEVVCGQIRCLWETNKPRAILLAVRAAIKQIPQVIFSILTVVFRLVRDIAKAAFSKENIAAMKNFKMFSAIFKVSAVPTWIVRLVRLGSGFKFPSANSMWTMIRTTFSPTAIWAMVKTLTTKLIKGIREMSKNIFAKSQGSAEGARRKQQQCCLLEAAMARGPSNSSSPPEETRDDVGEGSEKRETSGGGRGEEEEEQEEGLRKASTDDLGEPDAPEWVNNNATYAVTDGQTYADVDCDESWYPHCPSPEELRGLDTPEFESNPEGEDTGDGVSAG